MSILGTRVIRTEDPRLLTAGGVYVDDLREPELAGAVRATFVRATVAHALITGIDKSEALTQPGVVAVLTAADMTDLPAPEPPGGEVPGPDEPPAEGPVPLGGKWAEPLLAVDRVRFVGEPVAIVLTDGTYQGEDAAELVSVDYEVLPAVTTIDGAFAGESLLFPDAGTNVCVRGGRDISDDSIFEGCDVVVEGDIVNQRVACLPMEGRATAAAFSGGKLTVWASTQNAQLARLIFTAIGLPPDAIRVVAPDVGGGFGA
ncbi:MAG: molybdopterin cofactor-binding domain-containing protein, partial [Trebonia sp.]